MIFLNEHEVLNFAQSGLELLIHMTVNFSQVFIIYI